MRQIISFSLFYSQQIPSRHSQQWKHQNNVWNMFDVNDVVLVLLLLTLNRFHTLFWCFHCWLWTNKCRLGSSEHHDGRRYLRLCQTSMMAFTLQNSSLLKPLTISAKSSTIDVWQETLNAPLGYTFKNC